MQSLNKRLYKIIFALPLAIIVLLNFYCSSTTHYMRPDEPTELGPGYTDTDLKMFAEKMARSFAKFTKTNSIKTDTAAYKSIRVATIPEVEKNDIECKDEPCINTKSITDKIMVSLMKLNLKTPKGQEVTFIERDTMFLHESANESERLSPPRGKNPLPGTAQDTPQDIPQLKGATHYLFGDLRTIDMKTEGTFDPQKIIYYQFTLKLVNAKTSKIVWSEEKEIKKIGSAERDDSMQMPEEPVGGGGGGGYEAGEVIGPEE